jgi:hypothetical protein
MCDLFGQFIDLTSRPRSPEKNYTPNYPIPSTPGLDYQFGEIKPNPIISIQIPRMDLEQYRYVSPASKRTPIKYPSTIEESEEEDLLKKYALVRALARLLESSSLYLR